MKDFSDVTKTTWEDLLPSLIKYPVYIYKNTETIAHYYKKAQVLLDRGQTNIVILGRAGVGKTVLLEKLDDQIGFKFNLPETSKKAEGKAIQIGNSTKIIRTIPGQIDSTSLTAYDNAFLCNSELEGVIYVVDFGFNHVRGDVPRKQLIQNGILTLEEYRIDSLAKELEDYKAVCNRIKEYFIKNVEQGIMGMKWMIIAINKADLFYQDQDEKNKAEQYYYLDSNSAFNLITHDFCVSLGKLNIKTVTLPVCSYPQNFEWNGEERKTNIGELQQQNDLIHALINQMNEFSN